MAYDFSKVAKEAARSTAEAGGEQEYKYKLVYPGEGKIKFRLLFNPKSGLVGRLITRHNIDGKKVLCASTYSHKSDCPICKALEEVSNMGMQYPREYNARTRAIFLAQFFSADYEVASGNIKRGDIFILMTPYTIYKEINKWISDFSQDSAIMAKVFGGHEYCVQVIEKGKDSTDWSFRPDPNLTIESAKTDDEFAQLLESQDSLYELCGFHEKITPEEVALMHTTAEGIRDAFIGGGVQAGYQPPVAPVVDRNIQVNPAPVSQPQYAAPATPTPTVAQPTTSAQPVAQPVVQTVSEAKDNHPSCWGNYVGPEVTDPSKKASQTRCKYCPVSVQCKSVQ